MISVNSNIFKAFVIQILSLVYILHRSLANLPNQQDLKVSGTESTLSMILPIFFLTWRLKSMPK